MTKCAAFGLSVNSHIGIGTGGHFTLETLLIVMHAAQITAIVVYITFGPPKMELLPEPMSHGTCMYIHVPVL